MNGTMSTYEELNIDQLIQLNEKLKKRNTALERQNQGLIMELGSGEQSTQRPIYDVK
jgi:hypothetical protein